MRFNQLFIIALLLSSPWSVHALEPSEVMVIANSNVSDSVKLARYYMEQRGIPKENLISVDTTSKETCSRNDFNEEIAGPIREFLYKRQGGKDVRCLVTMFGVPLKVDAPKLTKFEKQALQERREALADLQRQLKELSEPKGAEAKRLSQQISAMKKQLEAMGKQDQKAAVDSELTLVLAEKYPLQGWVPNPFFVGFQGKKMLIGKTNTIMVARLDGPSRKIVERMIADSLAAEATGLKGTAYFDARWTKPSLQKQLQGNAFYDNSLYLAAEQVSLQAKMRTLVNSQQALFQPGEAPRAALYAGWYSLAHYVDAFDWVPGAVGYHIASQECQTLQGNGKHWCKSMLEDGASATIGPVAEPYLTAFPVPELFFKVLTDGYYTLAEAYFLSLPYLSWQMILVGDPLYRPFKNAE